MKKISILAFVAGIFLFVACGGGSKEVTLSDKGKMICDNQWKLQINETIKGTTDSIKDTTGITANIELKGDVGKIADFFAETIVFAVDGSDKSKLSYKRTIGEGLLSSSVVGFWEFNADETAIIMKEWDATAGAEKAPETYKIQELTADKLVLLKDGASSPNIYAKK